MSRARRTVFGTIAVALALAGCGSSRQDAGARHGTFTVTVARASFPSHQALGSTNQLVLAFHNAGRATVPNLTVTVHGLSRYDPQSDLADHTKPVWIVDYGPGARSPRPIKGTGAFQPGGDVTADPQTWQAGPLRAGRTATLRWTLTATRPGTYAVSYTAAGGLYGGARARTPAGAPVHGTLQATIEQAPAQTHVDPLTGRVVAGPPAGGGGR